MFVVNFVFENHFFIFFTGIIFRNEEFLGNWNDIIKLYELEKKATISLSQLSFEAVYPSPIQRQWVDLMQNVFNDKVVAALRTQSFNKTADFLELFVRCWKMVNVKDKSAHTKLRDDDRKPFCTQSDDRFQFLADMADSVGGVKGGRGFTRHQSFTSETKTAFRNTILGLIEIVKRMLQRDHSYVLTGHIQSDGLEAEFGIYRYLIDIPTVLVCLLVCF